MFAYPSMMRRALIAKSAGMAVGCLILLITPWIYPNVGFDTLIGWWLWMIAFGGIIALAGLYDRVPLFGWPLPFWIRGPFLGLALFLILALIAEQDISAWLAQAPDWWPQSLRNRFLILIDGALLGLIFDWLATRWGGEGKSLQDLR